jgi:soluble lytic murein transglycosylase
MAVGSLPVGTRTLSAQEIPAPQSSAADSAVTVEVVALLEQDRVLAAGRVLERRLSSGKPAEPSLILLSARTYAAYRAWPSVRRLLLGQPWLKSEEGGAGLELLARAYLEMDSVQAALAAFEEYLPPTSRGTSTGGPFPEARVHHASALDAAGRHADAGSEYERAAANLADIRGWVLLSALQQWSLAEDTASVRRVGERVLSDSTLPPDSVRRELALAAFRAGEPAEGRRLAAEGSQRLQDELAAEWIAPSLLATGDTAGVIKAYRDGLRAGSGTAATAASLASLDSSWQVLAEVGGAERRAGRRSSGKRYLRQALERAPAAEQPGLAAALAAAERADGQHTRAVTTLGPWLHDGLTGRSRASIWLLAARSFLSLGQRRAAREAFTNAAAAGPHDDAAYAAYLLADLEHDADNVEAARAAYRLTASRFPRTNYGGLALMRLGLLEFREGRYAEAAEEFGSYRRRFPRGRWYQGAIYWSGRALEAVGDSAAARALYRETLGRDPLGYYATLAGPRAGVEPWDQLNIGPPTHVTLDPADSLLLMRMDRLRRLGWDERARFELRTALDTGRQTADRRLALALTLNRNGWTWDGVRLAWRVRGMKQRWTRRLLEAIYPLPYRVVLEDVVRARSLDAAFVAGLIRRESLFDPGAVSAANAVGLMQLLPATAQDVSRRAGLSEYRRDQLVVPEVNLRLGATYLADMLERFGGSTVAALISYNAGPHRYLRWRDLAERTDPELFVERIPFRETRDYVKAVRAHAYIYRRLYGLEVFRDARSTAEESP